MIDKRKKSVIVFLSDDAIKKNENDIEFQWQK
jgi:hypothetical protein